jgi:hypothetical protein
VLLGDASSGECFCGPMVVVKVSLLQVFHHRDEIFVSIYVSFFSWLVQLDVFEYLVGVETEYSYYICYINILFIEKSTKSRFDRSFINYYYSCASRGTIN